MKKYHELDASITKELASCHRFLQCLHEDHSNILSTRSLAQRKLNDDRNALSAVLRGSDVPVALAKAGADCIQKVSKFEKIEDIKKGRTQLPKSATTDKTVWIDPQWIPGNEELWEEGGTHWHRAVKSWFTQYHDGCLRVHREKAESMIVKKLSHAHKAIEPNDAAHGIAWNLPKDELPAEGIVFEVSSTARRSLCFIACRR